MQRAAFLALLLAGHATAQSDHGRDVSLASLFGREVPAVRCGGKYGGRDANRARLAPPISDAIDEGLGWLAGCQADDGHWSAKSFLPGADVEGAGLASSDLGVTAFATLAFLQDGRHTEVEPYRATVRNAIVWLARAQDPKTGRFDLPLEDRHLLHHAVATLAMCEAYGLSRREELRAFAGRGAAFCLRARDDVRLEFDRSVDIATSTWAIFALRAAEDFEVGPLDSWAHEFAAWTAFRPPKEAEDRPTDGIEAAQCGLALLWLGDDRNPDVFRHLRVVQIAQGMPRPLDRVEALFLARFSYQLGGSAWQVAERGLAPIAATQRDDGACAGSWDPAGDWAREGGRVHATAIALLTLETPHAYTRLMR